MSRSYLDIALEKSQNQGIYPTILRGTQWLFKHKAVLPLHRSEFFSHLFYELSRRKLCKETAHTDCLGDVLDIAYNFSGWGIYWKIKPQQNRDTLKKLIQEVSRIEPKVVLEIGSAHGGSLFAFTQMFQSAHLFISIDLPIITDSRKADFFHEFPTSAEMVTIQSDSHSKKVQANVRKELDGLNIDFLFLDGDHSYEGVKQDFHDYSPFLSKNGLIAIDDINTVSGTTRFWTELEEGDRETSRLGTRPDQIGIVR